MYVHWVGFIEATIKQSHQSAEVTTKVTFTCMASGYQSDMFSYQWRINQTDIDGATSSSYIIPSVNESEHGTYECVVTNHWNEMEVSAPVQLNVTSMSTTMDVWMYAVRICVLWQLLALGLIKYS